MLIFSIDYAIITVIRMAQLERGMNMDNDQLICYCDNVTKGQIIEAMDQGAKTLADIKRMTGACCSCKCAELNPSGKCCAQDIAMVMHDYINNHK